MGSPAAALAFITAGEHKIRVSNRKWSSGGHTITAMAKDGAGNTAWAAGVSVRE